MEKILSNGVKHQIVPENFIFPPDKRPGFHVTTFKQVPVIHLTGDNPLEISNQTLRDGEEFLSVAGRSLIMVSQKSDMMQVTKDYFDMPIEEKASYCSEDTSKIPRLFTSQEFNNQELRLWRDCLRLVHYKADNGFTDLYPEKPSRFRNVAAKYTEEVDGLAKGLGLDNDYFSGKLTQGAQKININHYPPCPDPSLTLGLPKHCDPNLITILLQGNVSRLQVLHDGEWVQVDPIPNAFVMNFGHVLEIKTNGLLKSVEHLLLGQALPRSLRPLKIAS